MGRGCDDRKVLKLFAVSAENGYRNLEIFFEIWWKWLEDRYGNAQS
jgi:hypothetical protein